MDQIPVSLRVVGQAFSDWWDDWVNMVVINLVWALCWLTIVLGPPATFGLYHVTNRLVEGQAVELRGMLEGIRRYFLQSWSWMLLNLVAAAVIWLNVGFYLRFESVWAGLLRWTMVFIALLWGIVQFYSLPYLMEQEQKRLGLALRNGLFTALAAPGYTLVVGGIAASIVVISLVTIFPLLFGGPCLVAALGNRAVRERLETYRVRERQMAQGGRNH